MTFSAGFGSPMATPTSVLAHILLTKKENIHLLKHFSITSILNLKTVMPFSGMLPSPGPYGYLQENHEV